ncbi:tyrosine-type recombinase/integrase [Microbacterium rhizophilus]|uniref:tyrosine-type recombinase/integrase n=1 Tax=Microbacterium rhizophilus TaxID=3138934 RepID=UPI0031EF6F28
MTRPDPADLHPWIAGYLTPYTGRTRQNATQYLRRWETWCGQRGTSIEDATRTDIEAWRAHLSARGVRARGIGAALSPVRGLYLWAAQSYLITHDPAHLVRMPRRPTRSQRPWLDRHQLRRLLDYVDHAGDPAMRAAVHLWSLCGLRPAEPRQLLISDLGTYEGRMSIGLSYRKAGGADRLTVSPPVEAAIRAAVAGRGRGPVLYNENTGTALSKAIARLRLIRILDAARVPHVTPYGLRAGFITLSLEAGVPERDVMYAAGHSSSAQTAYYDRMRHTIRARAVHELTDWLDLTGTPGVTPMSDVPATLPP